MYPSQGAVPAQAAHVQVAPPATPRRSRYSCAVKSLGILQIIAATVSVIFGIAAIVAWSPVGVISSGIWGGLLFYLPAGILGVLSVTVSVTSRRCLAVACMVMSIFASIVAVINIGIHGASLGVNSYYYHGSYYNYGGALAMDSILVVIALTELVVSIVAAVYCCYVMNEYQIVNNTTIQYVSTQGYPNTVMVNQPVAGYAPNPPVVMANQAVPPSYGAGADEGEGMANDKIHLA